MNHALTLSGTIITGIHWGTKTFTSKTFAKNPRLAMDEVLPVQSPAEYERGTDIREYENDGRLKPLVWRIQNGYAKLPPNTEIINDELVNMNVPESEAPVLVKETLQGLRAEIKALSDQLLIQGEKIASVEMKVNPINKEPVEEVLK